MHNILHNINILYVVIFTYRRTFKTKTRKMQFVSRVGTTNREYCLLLSFVHNIIYYAAVVAVYYIKHKNM